MVLTGSSNLSGVALSGLLAGLSVAANPAPNTVLLNLLDVKITLNEQIVVGNQVTVNAIHFTLNNALLTGLGLLSGDITIAQSVATMTDCALPDLAMSKSGPGTATVGTPYNYVLSLANVGTGPTTGTITVTDTLQTGLTINSVTPAANFNCGTVAQTVTCTSTIALNAGVSNDSVATINVTPTQVGAVTNTATVSGGGDISPPNNTSPPVNTTVSAAGLPTDLHAIPTLFEWMLGLLALLLAAAGVAGIRGRRLG